MKFTHYYPSTELKTERTQLLLRPTVKNCARKIASKYGMSLNDYVNRILEKEIRRELSNDKQVVLMGRLVADPELKTTNTGISVTSFRIAVDRAYVKQGAERQADFFDIVAWRHDAEFVCKHFSKGSLIALEGQLQSRQFTTKDGQNRTAIEVVADNISFTGERKETSSQANYDEYQRGGLR